MHALLLACLAQAPDLPPLPDTPADVTAPEPAPAPDEDITPPDEEAVVAEPAPGTPAAPALPEDVTEARPMALARGLPALGAVAGVLGWAPSLVVCCGSAALMGAVYPASLGDPSASTTCFWPSACFCGVWIGMGGWLLGLTGTVVGTALVAAGLLTGSVLARTGAFLGSLRSVPVIAALGAVAVAGLPALVAAGMSGVLPWLALVAWWLAMPSMPTGGAWVYRRWFALNVVFMSAVAGGLVLLFSSAALPALAGIATYAGTSYATGSAE